MVYGYNPEWKRGGGVATEERRRGIPRSNAERVAQHYGIPIEEAEEWLRTHPVDVLLPERGAGLEIPLAFERAFEGAVAQGIPTGSFISPYIEVEGYPDRQVPVGEQIRLRAHYSAHCPGQPWYAPAWTVSVKAVGDGIAVKNDSTHATEGPVTGHPNLNTPSYPIMPNRTVTLEVTLWGNPDAWQELPL